MYGNVINVIFQLTLQSVSSLLFFEGVRRLSLQIHLETDSKKICNDFYGSDIFVIKNGIKINHFKK